MASVYHLLFVDYYNKVSLGITQACAYNTRMMNNLNLFAHEGHDHEEESATTITLPSIDFVSQWYVGLAIFIAVTAAMAAVAYKLFKKSVPAATNTILVICLIAGMLLFQYAPIVSVVAIVTGFILAFFVVLAGLSAAE